MHRIAGIAFLCISGFLLYIGTLICLCRLGADHNRARLGVLAVVVTFALVAMAIGIAARGFGTWRRDVGVTLVTTGCFNVFLILTLACIVMTPELDEYFPPERKAFISNFRDGGLYLGVLLAGGLAALHSARSRSHK